MTGISSIVSDWGDAPRIVRIQTSDGLATVGSNGYILSQLANITAANNGPFTWASSDSVLVYAADGSALYTISSDFNSLIALSSPATVSVALTSAQINGMYAAPVLLLGAPKNGTVNVVDKALLTVNYGSAQFASGGAIALQYEGTVHGAGTLATATVAAATLNGVTANEILLFNPATTILLAAATAQPQYLSNQTGAFTTGDSTAILTVVYRNVAA